MSKNTVKSALTRKRRSRTRQRRSNIRNWVLLMVRFVCGLPLNGRRSSNATFWQPGTHRVGRPAYLLTWQWWALAAGWQRAGLRLTAVAVLVLLTVGVIAR
jgi:hypothetical protein